MNFFEWMKAGVTAEWIICLSLGIVLYISTVVGALFLTDEIKSGFDKSHKKEIIDSRK